MVLFVLFIPFLDLATQINVLRGENMIHFKGIAEMFADIQVQMEQLIKTKDTSDGMEQIFPLENEADMIELEKKIDNGDDRDLVNAVKKVIHRGGMLKNFRYLVGPEIIKDYNYDGVQNKKSFKRFYKIDTILFKAVESEEINYEMYTNMIRKAFKLGKNKLYKDKCLSQVRIS